MICHPSPNFGPRREGLTAQLVVIHYTAMPSTEAALKRLCDPAAEVSAHYLIAENGCIFALVPEDQRAWHAGAGQWAGLADVNSASIGIELANDGAQPFAHPQMLALETLLRQILQRWSIPPERVIAHSDMAPTRKQDPGPRFDWARLARLGLVLGPNRGGRGDAPLDLSLDALGYPPCPPETRLAAFRLRFRPWAKGPETAEDRALADALACASSFSV